MKPELAPAGSPALAVLQQDFDAIERRLAGTPLEWTLVHRRAAFARFLELGFPTIFVEAWRATPLRKLQSTPFEARPAEPLAHEVESHRVETPWVVIANGQWAGSATPGATLPEGVQVLSYANALRDLRERVEPLVTRPVTEEKHPFRLLNAALAEDGVVVVVKKGVELTEPITLPFMTLRDPVISHPRTLLFVEEGARATIAEVHQASQGHPWCNALTDVVLEEGAFLEHVRVTESGPEAFHLGSARVRQARGSSYLSHVITLGGSTSRTEVEVTLGGEGAECTLNGLAVAQDTETVDHQTSVDHALPHGSSRQLYKGILAGRAKHVFNGRIVVRKDAQSTDAKQTNRNLMLSSEAVVDTKPELEIHANDVKCQHGATIGRIDPMQLFYLRSRGLDEHVARQALTQAFASEMIDRIRHASLRKHLEDAVRASLAKATKGAAS